jgi:cobalt/nickel transport system permease protein
MAAHGKVVGTLLFVASVVATPRAAIWAFAVHACIVVGIAAVVGISPPKLLRRMTIELPFLAFAVLLPIVGRSPRTDIVGLSLSEPGLWSAWSIVAKGSLGVAATVVLTSTTATADLIGGLGRLRMPMTLTAIASFMVRYGEVLRSELDRMRIARVSRAHSPRFLWQAKAIASTAGTLFVRSYERGERVHLAMLSRGYAGHLPCAANERPAQWVRCLTPGAVSAAVAAVALAAT